MKWLNILANLAYLLHLWGKSVAMKKLLFLSVILVITFLSCKKSDLASKGDPVSPPNTFQFNVKKNTILQLVNSVRQSGCTCGSTIMPPVATISWNDQLGKAAYDHSVDMNTQNYFSHTSLSGTTPGQRITAAGYSWSTYGENIALGYSTEETVIAAWLKSEGHCKNIMNGNFKEMGVGKESNYWTQVFGSQ